ncbi:hypothetical protein [Saccharopolyspora spinosa]|uniref:hypothetical protein n=1 Tax=Saccharopolyspora spinosa TaxID=60894 RepID=UPI00023792CC
MLTEASRNRMITSVTAHPIAGGDPIKNLTGPTPAWLTSRNDACEAVMLLR